MLRHFDPSTPPSVSSRSGALLWKTEARGNLGVRKGLVGACGVVYFRQSSPLPFGRCRVGILFASPWRFLGRGVNRGRWSVEVRLFFFSFSWVAFVKVVCMRCIMIVVIAVVVCCDGGGGCGGLYARASLPSPLQAFISTCYLHSRSTYCISFFIGIVSVFNQLYSVTPPLFSLSLSFESPVPVL